MNNSAQTAYDELQKLTPGRLETKARQLPGFIQGVPGFENAIKEAEPVQLDDGTQQAINEQAANAGADDMQELLAGIPKAKGLLSNPSAINADARSLGMSLPSDFSQSLAMRSEKDFDRHANDLKTEAEFEKPIRQAKRYAAASDSFGKGRQVEMNNYAIKNQRWAQKMAIEQANAQAKASFLSSALGLVGTIIGAAVAGPAGAAVGGAAAGAVGSQL